MGSMFSEVYCTCCVKMFVTQHNPWTWWKDGTYFFFLAVEPSDSLLPDRHMNFLPYLHLQPYLSPSIPPHLPNPISPWILSHTLDSLSVIQRCVFFKCLGPLDFELWMPQAPSRDLRGPAVWPPIYHISPAAMKRRTPSIQHSNTRHKYWPHQYAIEAQSFSDCTQIEFVCGKTDNMTPLQKSVV